MTSTLVLIDLQNDYFPGGAMELEGSPEAVSKAALALGRFRELRRPVVHVRHLAQSPEATFFLPGTPGADIHAAVSPRPGEAVMVKHFPNSFRETGLKALLDEQGPTELVVCGMMTHMCVDATVRAAFDLGYPVTLVHDACATRALEFGGLHVPAAHVQASFLAALARPYARIVDAASFLETIISETTAGSSRRRPHSDRQTKQ